ncbi:MAG: protein kinase [Candidatus Omnitrophica bacterium]|nr:protein kinase [Candidatus Omnitrophota bacterium]
MNSNEFTPFNAGDIIDDRYRVDDVKRGNMGIVYLCSDIEKDEPVAVKTFDERLLDTEAGRRQFLTEASIWIQLERHPNIVEARFLKLIDNHPYLFLERVIADNVRGATLKDRLFTQTIDYRQVLQIAIHICDGMIHALTKFPDLVHRDLKSENILIGREGTPKISDFGMTISPLMENEDGGSDRSNQNIGAGATPSEWAKRMEGAPAYASPEQCQCRTLDTRSDIYSFGCILYHMTTRQLPFHRATVDETILAQIQEKPASPQSINPRVPDELCQLILKCLEKRPGDRFDSFDSLRMELIDLYEFTFFERPQSIRSGFPLTLVEYLERAKSFALLHQYAHARSELLKAVQLDSACMEVYYWLGRCSFLSGQANRAIIELNEALKGMHDHPEIHEMLGKAYLAFSFDSKAEKHLYNAIRLAPERPDAYLELASLHIKRGKPYKAEILLMEGSRYCRDKSPFYRLLIDLFERSGDQEKLFIVLEKHLHENPEDVESLVRMAELSLDLRRGSLALEWADRAVKARPKSFVSLHRLGAIYSALNRGENAVELWKAAAQTGGGDGFCYREIAEALNGMRRYGEAWQYLVMAEEKGENVQALKEEIRSRVK